jgi:hypothetical protein
MTENEAAISDLIAIASVPTNRIPEARQELSLWLLPEGETKSRARIRFDNAGQQGTSDYHDHYLERVAKAAACLLKELEDLRKRPYAHANFWLHEIEEGGEKSFGPIHGNMERDAVFPTIRKISAVARAAQIRRKGRPPAIGARLLVLMALELFKKFSPQPLSTDISSPCQEFVRLFVATAGVDLTEGAISHQIESVLTGGEPGKNPV